MSNPTLSKIATPKTTHKFAPGRHEITIEGYALPGLHDELNEIDRRIGCPVSIEIDNMVIEPFCDGYRVDLYVKSIGITCTSENPDFVKMTFTVSCSHDY